MFGTSSVASTILVLFASSLGIGSAGAQDYPSKLIRLVVPYSPASNIDPVARIVGAEMGKILAQPIVVENKPGADATIGFEYVAKQPADGYTFAIASVSGLATLSITVKDLRFDPLKDLPPLIGIAEGRYIFGSSSKLPWKTFKELVTYAKANPGKLNYGASTTINRLQAEAIIRDLGLSVAYIPYSAGGAYVQALGTAEIHMGLASEGSAQSLGDRFRILAVTGTQRRAPFLDVPTFEEVGFPQILGLGYSFNVPAGMPRSVFGRLHAAAAQALQQSDVRARFEKLGLDIVGGSPEAAAKRLLEEATLYADIARKVGIQPQ